MKVSLGNLDPKLIIAFALFSPILYIWAELEFNVIILAGVAIGTYIYFDNNFITKAEHEASKKKITDLAPHGPYMPREMEYDIDPNTYQPVRKPVVPPGRR